MADTWERPGEAVQVVVDNEDLEISFFVEEDSEGVKTIMCRLSVWTTTKKKENVKRTLEQVEQAGIISSAEHSGLLSVLPKIRNGGLGVLGYTKQ